MGCGSFGVTQILVGLHRVGVVGLKQALQQIEGLNLDARDEIVDRLLKLLAVDNLIPDRMIEDYRTALWREFLRRKGEDLSPFYSRVALRVCGSPGERRDDFVELLTSVFGDFELRPVYEFDSANVEGPSPQVMHGEHLIVAGQKTRERLKAAVRRSFSDW